MKIRCMTLFDITQTGVSSRRQLLEINSIDNNLRKQQSNFETILQIISLRCQPEGITIPEITEIGGIWGTGYGGGNPKCWTFSFSVEKKYAFTSGGGLLTGLLEDCANVPMFTGLGESAELRPFLELCHSWKNIEFEVLDEEHNR